MFATLYPSHRRLRSQRRTNLNKERQMTVSVERSCHIFADALSVALGLVLMLESDPSAVARGNCTTSPARYVKLAGLLSFLASKLGRTGTYHAALVPTRDDWRTKRETGASISR